MLKLLIAEDESLERQALRFIFERSNRNIKVVGEAGNGWQTVEMSKELRPDIVFMDIKMPGIDGLQATRAIKECHPDAKIVLLTAHSEFSYAQEALRLGAIDYVLKPARPADLLTVLDRAIATADAEKRDRRLREILKEAMPYIQLGYVNDLISGNISSDDEALGRAQLIGLSSFPNLAMAIDIDHFSVWSSNLSETEKAIAKDEVFRLGKEALDGYSNCLLVPQTTDKLTLMICIDEDESDEAAREKAIQIGDNIRQTVQRGNSLSVTIGVGRRYRSSLELKKSYNEALSALRYKLFLGRNRVISIDEVESVQGSIAPYPYERERQLCEAIRTGDVERATQTAFEVLQCIIDSAARQPEAVKARVLELLVLSSRAAIEGGADAHTMHGANMRYAQELVNIDSSSELQNWLVQAIAEMIRAVVAARYVRNRAVVDRAAKFVRANCTKDLTLEQVAEAVNLSPFYFSRVFKQEQGCTFIEFLIKARIEEAKKLLRTSKLSITEISFAVGYQDPNYFSQLFRHSEGITPSQYRRNTIDV